MVVFMIIGANQEPIYELELPAKSTETGSSSTAEDGQYLDQFVLYSSLDVISSLMWTNSSTYLRVVDKFNSQLVSAYVTSGGKCFLLLHNGKSDDAVRAFFVEVHELFVKYLVNPFAAVDGPVVSPLFNQHVKLLAKRILL